MALTNDYSNGMIMPVQPMYGGGYGGNAGGFGFGGDWAWILLLLVLGGGWGGFGGFGMGGAMMGAGMMDGFGLYPWLDNSQHISDGFRDQQMSAQIGSIGNAVTAGFGDVQTALCGGFAGVNQNVSNGTAAIQNSLCAGFNGVNTAIAGAQAAVSQQMYANQIADMERSYAAQTAQTQSANAIQTQLATEECATRNAAAMNTRDIIDSQTRSTQAILDKLCALELDTVKTQLAQAQRDNAALQNAVNMATMQASQVQQTADIINGTYTRLSQCPVSSTPVYGNQPIFTCPQTVSSGCGCGSF